MNVALLGPVAPLAGGIVQHTRALAQALETCGHDVSILGLNRLYPLAPVRVAERSPEGRLDALDPRTWTRGRDRLALWRPDRVVVEYWHPLAAAALATTLAGTERERVTTIVHNHLPHEGFPLARTLTRRMLARSGTALCHSAFVAAQTREIGGPSLQVHARALPPLLAGEAAPAEASGAGPATLPTVLAAGVGRSHKGLATLLEAWRGARLGQRARLFLLGARPWSARRRETVLGEGDDSIYTKFRYVSDSEFVGSLNSAAVVVLPYTSATQSGVAPIAAALGCRLVVTDVGGLSEQVPADGGSVVPAGDTEALARALGVELDRALAEPRDRSRSRESLAAAYRSGWREIAEWICAEERLSPGA